MPFWRLLKASQLPSSLSSFGAIAASVQKVLSEASEPLETGEIAARSGYSVASVRSVLYLLQKHTNAVEVTALSNRRKVAIAALEKSTAVKRWMDKIKDGAGKPPALYAFARFMTYAKQQSQFRTPEELVDSASNSTQRDLYKHLDLVLAYVNSMDDVNDSTRQRHYHHLRSFYLHNRCPLPSERLNLHAKQPVIKDKSKGADLILGDIRKAVMHSKCSIRDRAVVMCMVQGAMDDSTFAELFNIYAFPQFSKYFQTEDWAMWDVSCCPVRVDLVRPKADNHEFYTFLDKDAITSLKEWLNVRRNLTGERIRVYEPQRQDELATSDPIFTVGGGRGIRPGYISNIFRELGFRAGINVKPAGSAQRFRGAKRRYKFHSHECRDIFISLARVCGVDPAAANFFAGHSVDKMGYDKSPWEYTDYYRQQYMLMSPYLNVVSNPSDVQELLKQRDADQKNFQKEIEARDLMIRSLMETQKRSERRLASYDRKFKTVEKRLEEIAKAANLGIAGGS